MTNAADEHMVRLGKIAVNAHAFELSVGKVLCESLAIEDRVGLNLARQLQLARTLDVISAAATSTGCPLDQVAVEKWLPLARRAAQARDTAIHRAWFAEAEGGELTSVLKKGELVPASPQELDKTRELLFEAMNEGQKLLKA